MEKDLEKNWDLVKDAKPRTVIAAAVEMHTVGRNTGNLFFNRKERWSVTEVVNFLDWYFNHPREAPQTLNN